MGSTSTALAMQHVSAMQGALPYIYNKGAAASYGGTFIPFPIYYTVGCVRYIQSQLELYIVVIGVRVLF